jgi:hypothetical protein
MHSKPAHSARTTYSSNFQYTLIITLGLKSREFLHPKKIFFPKFKQKMRQFEKKLIKNPELDRLLESRKKRGKEFGLFTV